MSEPRSDDSRPVEESPETAAAAAGSQADASPSDHPADASVESSVDQKSGHKATVDNNEPAAQTSSGLPPVVPPIDGVERPPSQGGGTTAGESPADSARPRIRTGVTLLDEQLTDEQVRLEQLKIDQVTQAEYDRQKRGHRRRLRLSLTLFVLTFLSTTLVGAENWPLDIVAGFFSPRKEAEVLTALNFYWPPAAGETPTLADRLWESLQRGCTYSMPLMLILFCHEMGHFLQAIRNKVPASLPYFIPLPLPPLGTMGAVILQGRGAADRRKMFDIAVTGPIAGLVVTIPVLYYGISTSGYEWRMFGPMFEFGQPLLVQWLIDAVHGPTPMGQYFAMNGWATAGWVGVFVTAMNLLPVGQLDGGHIMYTLIRKPAHYVAWGLIITAVGAMIYTQMFSYVLLLILLTLTGPRHPPTSNDNMSLGWHRHIIGWLTLSFLMIGFTPQPIMFPESRPVITPDEFIEPVEDALYQLFGEDAANADEQ